MKKFIKENIFSTLNCLGTFVKNQLNMYEYVYFWPPLILMLYSTIVALSLIQVIKAVQLCFSTRLSLLF